MLNKTVITLAVAGAVWALAGSEIVKNTPLRIMPVNTAETIIVPFMHHSDELGDWSITGDEVKINFKDDAKINFKNRLVMTRETKFDTGNFDDLVFSLFAPKNAAVSIKVDTSEGERKLETTVADDTLKVTEFTVPLNGAKVINRIRIEVTGTGNLQISPRWVIAANRQELVNLDQFYRDLGKMDWHDKLNLDAAPKFTPAWGLYGSAADVERVRQQLLGDPKIKAELEREAARIKALPSPETRIRPYNTEIRRFVRDRDLALGGQHVGEAAWYGILLKDPELMQIAAKGAIALAITPNWGAGMYSSLPGTTVEHRCFDEVEIVEQLVMILDLCNDLFTDNGKELILRALCEKGLSAINYTCWKWDYIYACNQMGHFSGGRVAAYLALEKSGWKHVAPYTDQAIADLNQSMEQLLLADGGYKEGAHYFQFTFRSALPAYFIYARARGKNPADVLPEVLKKSGRFAEMILSTDDTQGTLPLNDGRSYIHPSAAMLFAAVMPDTPFARLANRFEQVYGMPPVKEYWCYLAGQAGTKRPEVALTPFLMIDSIASAASTRKNGDAWTKIMISGDILPAAHRHMDAGSFVWESRGETLLMDSGICDYAYPAAAVLQGSSRHNVMAPVTKEGNVANQSLSKTPLKLIASGDEKTLQAKIDLAPAWPDLFTARTREWISADPDHLTVTDTWQLTGKADKAVSFLLSPYPFTIDGHNVTVEGKKNKLTFAVPEGWSLKAEKLERPKMPDQYRLTMETGQKQGSMTLNFVTAPR